MRRERTLDLWPVLDLLVPYVLCNSLALEFDQFLWRQARTDRFPRCLHNPSPVITTELLAERSLVKHAATAYQNWAETALRKYEQRFHYCANSEHRLTHDTETAPISIIGPH